MWRNTAQLSRYDNGHCTPSFFHKEHKWWVNHECNCHTNSSQLTDKIKKDPIFWTYKFSEGFHHLFFLFVFFLFFVFFFFFFFFQIFFFDSGCCSLFLKFC